MSFRILNQAPQYLLPSGQVNAGGSLAFYETDLSTPKLTWSDEALSVQNPFVVQMDSAGRTATDVWGNDEEYGVVMSDRFGVEIWTRNNVRADAGAGNVIPALVAGQFLTNDGSVLQWQPILQLPDPAGLANFYLISDGEQAVWSQIPEPPDPEEPDIEVTADSFQAGISDDPTKFRVLRGTGEAPATNALNSTVGIAFSPGFDALWGIVITPITSGCTSNSPPALPSWSVTGWTPGSASSGATVNFYVCPVQTISSEDMISSAIPFAWVAFGTREVA